MKFRKIILSLIILMLLVSSAILPTSAATIQIGDVNGDGRISVVDATLIQKKLSGINTSERYFSQNSDFDRSGYTNIIDVTLIQKQISGIIEIYGNYIIAFNGGSASVYKYFGTETSTTVPTRLFGHDITSIDQESFYNNKTLTTVTLPSTVTKIDDYAFSNCANLKTVYAKNKNIKWGNSFINCPKFQAIKFI